ncbi:MAG: GDP-mannose 4,6-dehydratase [Rhodospirillales bacterium]|jgi:UDP-glucose 4-epimerase|nr:GDP-mannose 4,6-dehydratase [Rhodospirillales bacterium]
MNWTGKKALVTGADGFIGSHLTEALVRAGAHVTALAQYNSFDSCGWLDDLPHDVKAAAQIMRGDVRDAHQMATLCAGREIVFHLAALIAVPYSYHAPASYAETNVLGTVNVLAGARAAGNARVVHTSTSEVYGTARFTPITEDHPVQGFSPYSASKIGADHMAESFARSFALPVVILRPFNTYGPRQSERAVVGTLVRQMLDPHCEAIRLGDLAPERDFTFVDDTVAAFIKAAELDGVANASVFNAGSGRSITIGDLVDRVRRVAGSDKPVVADAERTRPAESEVMALIADATRFGEASGWRAEIGLDDGLARTVDWWRGRLDRVRDGTDDLK